MKIALHLPVPAEHTRATELLRRVCTRRWSHPDEAGLCAALAGGLRPDAVVTTLRDAHGRSKAKELLKACKWVGHLTIVLTYQARQCARGDRALGRVDETWARYTNGTAPTTFRLWGRQFTKQVARKIPFDGVVPNESSRYPGLTDPNLDLPPVDGANHQSIYRRQDGVGSILTAMRRIQMDQPQPAPPRPTPPPGPLTASINGPSSVQAQTSATWQAAVSGGATPYTYQWSGVASGTGSSVTETLSASGTLELTVRDAAGTTAAASLYVDVYNTCGGALACSVATGGGSVLPTAVSDSGQSSSARTATAARRVRARPAGRPARLPQ
jgi:hypothetical protein